jgi:hypothetical protein
LLRFCLSGCWLVHPWRNPLPPCACKTN